MAHSVGVPLLYNIVIKFISGHENNTNVDVLARIMQRGLADVAQIIDSA